MSRAGHGPVLSTSNGAAPYAHLGSLFVGGGLVTLRALHGSGGGLVDRRFGEGCVSP